MTITYSLDISSSTFLGIHRLLFRWRGSIWKSILPELICWLLAYFTLSLTYRYAMDEAQRRYFEQLCKFFGDYIEYIPITFMLGFYVSAVFGRWNQIFDNLGWIDSPALLIATYVRGADEEARRIRRNIVRYLILTQAMVYRDISSCVQKRFPTMDHLVTAGIMTANELKEFDAVPSANIKYWTPIQWAFLLLQRAKDKKMIESDIIYTDMLEKIRQFRVNVLTLTLYDWVPIPLVYTQVVNLAVRSYFIVALLGRQYMLENVEDINIRKTVPDLFVPIMTILQFLFYIGWIKVAEVLLNPLGEDDDDFETNWIIDRNLQVGLSIVDDCYGRVPDLERDVFWEEAVPEPLYTPESAARPHNPMVGSCNDVSGQEDALLIQPRRRRLMSTMTSYDNAAFFKQSGAPSIAVETEDGMEIVPVENHNPSRRISVCANSFGESTHGRILDSVRRKFSKAPNSRRDSIASAADFERTMNGRLSNFDDTTRRATPRGSFTAMSYNPGHLDSLPVPFTQSLNLSHQKPSRPPIPGISPDSSIEQRFHESTSNYGRATADHNNDYGGENSNPPISPVAVNTEAKSPYQSNSWTINESMLPIIEEVQERLRRNARDTESVHSVDTSSLSSWPSSRKGPAMNRERTLRRDVSIEDENITTAPDKLNDLKDSGSNLTNGITKTSGTTTTTHAPIIATTETTSSTTTSRPSSTVAGRRDVKDDLVLIEENEEDAEYDDEEDDDEPPPLFLSPALQRRERPISSSASSRSSIADTEPPDDLRSTNKKSEESLSASGMDDDEEPPEPPIRKSPILSASNSPRPSIHSQLSGSRRGSQDRLKFTCRTSANGKKPAKQIRNNNSLDVAESGECEQMSSARRASMPVPIDKFRPLERKCNKPLFSSFSQIDVRRNGENITERTERDALTQRVSERQTERLRNSSFSLSSNLAAVDRNRDIINSSPDASSSSSSEQQTRRETTSENSLKSHKHTKN